MYKILIKNATKNNTWRIHGTNSVVDGKNVFTEFATDDKGVLGEEIYALTKQYGTDNLRIVYDIPYEVKIIASSAEKDKYQFFLVESE